LNLSASSNHTRTPVREKRSKLYDTQEQRKAGNMRTEKRIQRCKRPKLQSCWMHTKVCARTNRTNVGTHQFRELIREHPGLILKVRLQISGKQIALWRRSPSFLHLRKVFCGHSLELECYRINVI